MKYLPVYIVSVLILLSACSRGGKIIPRSDMSAIYAEMFLQDAQVGEEEWAVRRKMDTCLMYEPIFNKYGYTTADFMASQEKYILDATRYCRMLKKSISILEAQQKELKRQKEKVDNIRKAASNSRRYSPNRIYLLDTLHLDSLNMDNSLLNFDFQKGLDTVYSGLVMIVREDSIKIAQRLRELDRLDSLRRDSLVRDSIARASGNYLRPRPVLKKQKVFEKKINAKVQ